MQYTVILHRLGELRVNNGTGVSKGKLLIDCCSPEQGERGPYGDDKAGAFVKRVYLSKKGAKALKSAIEDFLDEE